MNGLARLAVPVVARHEKRRRALAPVCEPGTPAVGQKDWVVDDNCHSALRARCAFPYLGRTPGVSRQTFLPSVIFMPFIPHTQLDEQKMLSVLELNSIEELFDEIPESLRGGSLAGIGEGLSEQALMALMRERAALDVTRLNFIGAGAYEHHIPAAVWDLTTRGEFLTAYTPYQAEASQGTLQLIYEFQSMMTGLTSMDVSNASVYDGASALAEAVLMAVRANRKSRSRVILMPDSVHPAYRSACHNIVHNQDITLRRVALDETGTISAGQMVDEDVTALVIPYPGFFGTLEDVHALTDKAHAMGALVIAVVNPIALGLLVPPGEWGADGADIVVGEGQPLGIPLASGGPYLGFMCCRKSIVRQMPGRIVGATVDQDGKRGFALTLQAREQHIRRAKATSNICTNQGLLVTAATIYMSLLGPGGLRDVALACHCGLRQLLEGIKGIPGVSQRHPGPLFHEAVINLPVSADKVVEAMAAEGVAGGLALGAFDPTLDSALLVNVTETKSGADINKWLELLESSLEALGNG